MNLQGCGTALITPFQADGSIDESALVALVDWQIESGVHFLIPCGTTGEAATLTSSETERVIELVCATAAGRVPVFAGCTHNSTAEAVARVQSLARVPGLSGLLTANPYYNRPNQEGQYQHFKAIANAVDLPILLYNIPSRTGANLEPATVRRLAEITNVIGIKESSGNLVQITELLTTLSPEFKVFAGDDVLALPILALGAVGLISVASNVIPAETARLTQAAIDGDWARARSINREFYKLMQSLFLEPSPAPAKALLNIMGRAHDALRLPLVSVSAPVRQRLEDLIAEIAQLHGVSTARDLHMV
ncbi:4-hydroxy-tetrahydrodipicolinate synthase [Granulicella sibirica]|uniref:4-hydroxy-tetrahydrodipicolinate synthase n=1 Tax=Granulicella sibirica TaxID=2479048 RepID=A0A4V1L5Z8_9BACT|nr:4-hydroxy-tetrahydrodipicolinate synthase [Granulicella sibirica]RXH57514.1 4-hydroxy-tetrahydrodipicolinate synthase [Granulicella sibirica]